MASLARLFGDGAGPSTVERGIEDFEPPIEQCSVERSGVVQPAVSFDDVVRIGVRFAMEDSDPEVREVERVRRPVDVRNRLEVEVESVLLGNLSIKASHKLGDFFSRIEIASTVLVRLGSCHGSVGPSLVFGWERGFMPCGWRSRSWR